MYITPEETTPSPGVYTFQGISVMPRYSAVAQYHLCPFHNSTHPVQVLSMIFPLEYYTPTAATIFILWIMYVLMRDRMEIYLCRHLQGVRTIKPGTLHHRE